MSMFFHCLCAPFSSSSYQLYFISYFLRIQLWPSIWAANDIGFSAPGSGRKGKSSPVLPLHLDVAWRHSDGSLGWADCLAIFADQRQQTPTSPFLAIISSRLNTSLCRWSIPLHLLYALQNVTRACCVCFMCIYVTQCRFCWTWRVVKVLCGTLGLFTLGWGDSVYKEFSFYLFDIFVVITKVFFK